MKGIFRISASALTLSVLVIACDISSQEVSNETTASNKVTYEDGRLKFTSVGDYERLMSDITLLSKAIKPLQSLIDKETVNLRQSASSEKIPDALKRIMNKDNVCQVDKWVIRLNFDQRKVFVIEENGKASYNDLVTESSKESVFKFTFDDEVISLLTDGYKGTPKSSPSGRPAIFCGGGISGGNNGAYTKSTGFYCPPT